MSIRGGGGLKTMRWLGKSADWKLPGRLKIFLAVHHLDGGTVALHCFDENGVELQVIRGQTMCLEKSGAAKFVINGQPIPLRSEIEASVIRLLQQAEYLSPSEQNASQAEDWISDLRASTENVINFILSDKYVEVHERLSQSRRLKSRFR